MLHLQSVLTGSPNAYGVQLTNQKRFQKALVFRGYMYIVWVL